MATLSKPVGSEYEFVDQVPEDYFCKLCKHVAREPNLISCCGEIICKGCVDDIIQDKKPCPSCEDSNITSFPHVKYQRKILALEVHCTMKDRGCLWTGQLQHLNAHLDVTTGDCQYVDVECPKKCVQKVQKRNVDTHLANECPNRDYRCPHCNFANKYHVVSKHFDVCPYYPLACHNRCGATFERDDLPDHMKMCRLEEVQCVFGNEGCQAKFTRENEDEHMDRNTQKHLALMPAATLRISQDFEQKLQEKHDMFEKKLEQKDEEHKQRMQRLDGQLREQLAKMEQKLQEQQEASIKKLEQNNEQIKHVEQKLQEQQEASKKKLELNNEKIKHVEQKLQEQQETKKEFLITLKQKDAQIKTLEEQLQTNGQVIEQQQQAISQLCREVGIPPYDYILSNYQEEKAKDSRNDSVPMYTHPGGYRFILRVLPNGFRSGRGTHVTAAICSRKGDHDADLKVPVKCTITLQLLNQHRDQDHHARDIQCEMTREKIGRDIAIDDKFIPRADLEWNCDEQTQYLKDNCLKFRITKVVVQ